MLQTQSQHTKRQYHARTHLQQILLQPPNKCLIPIPAQSTVLQCSHHPAHGCSRTGTTRARGEDGAPEIGKEGVIKYILLFIQVSHACSVWLWEFPVFFIKMNRGPTTRQGGQLWCAAARGKEGSTTRVLPHTPAGTIEAKSFNKSVSQHLLLQNRRKGRGKRRREAAK